MEQLGKHILMDFSACDVAVLNNISCLEEALHEAAKQAKATIIKSHFHQFSPHGVTGVLVVAESHLSIHTWPEHNYAAVDFFTCDLEVEYQKVFEYLTNVLKSEAPNLRVLSRGYQRAEVCQ